jgi:hypothetical protein
MHQAPCSPISRLALPVLGGTFPPLGFLLGLMHLPPSRLFLPSSPSPGLLPPSSTVTFLECGLRPVLLALIPMVWKSIHLQWGVASFKAMVVPPHSLGGIHVFMGGLSHSTPASPLSVRPPLTGVITNFLGGFHWRCLLSFTVASI